MNYWYVARDNELFLDIDKMERSLPHARSRLQGAIECGRLPVRSVEMYPSQRNGHCHVIVTLARKMHDVERFAWEIILHGDIYRGCCNLLRWSNAVPANDVLISPSRFRHRRPNAICQCNGKHTAEVMEHCTAALALRGADRARGFFGKPSKNKCEVWK